MAISVNIEGLSSTKKELLANFCNDNEYDILCIQETYRAIDNIRSYQWAKSPQLRDLRLCRFAVAAGREAKILTLALTL